MLPHYCPPNPPFSPRPDPSTTHDNPPAPSLPIPPYWASQVRVYLDGSVPAPIISQLEYFGAQIVKMGDRGLAGGIGGMFWRFLVASDPGVDRFIVRDSDSRLNPRERLAVEEWILSGLQARGRRWRVPGWFGGGRGSEWVGWGWMGERELDGRMQCLALHWIHHNRISHHCGRFTACATTRTTTGHSTAGCGAGGGTLYPTCERLCDHGRIKTVTWGISISSIRSLREVEREGDG